MNADQEMEIDLGQDLKIRPSVYFRRSVVSVEISGEFWVQNLIRVYQRKSAARFFHAMLNYCREKISSAHHLASLAGPHCPIGIVGHARHHFAGLPRRARPGYASQCPR